MCSFTGLLLIDCKKANIQLPFLYNYRFDLQNFVLLKILCHQQPAAKPWQNCTGIIIDAGYIILSR
jgi:hypothetical protein